MAAGLGFKTFTTGEVLTAADTNGYLMQGVLVFASSAARAAAISSPQEGQYSYLKDTNSTEYYDGAAWIAAPIGDITGVTAGTGISGGGTSGTVTVTNSMATAIDAKGDLVVGTGADTFSRLAVGSNAQILVADNSTATGLAWSTPASGMTNPMTTTGDTIYSSSGSTPARLGSSTGQVLTVSGGVPSWTTPAGSGVKQVVTAVTTSGTSTSSTSYVDITGLSATITPSSTSSKILIFISSPYCDHYVSGSSTSLTGKFQILRNATVIVGDGYRALSNYASTSSFDNIMPFSQTAVDSPASTSALTYKLQIKVNSGTWEWATPAGVPASIILMEI